MQFAWRRGQDSNLRPSGYEPDELPLLHPAPVTVPPTITESQPFVAVVFTGGVGTLGAHPAGDTPMSDEQDHIALLIIQANHLKVIAEEAQRAFQNAQSELVDLMETHGVPSANAFEEQTGLHYTGTLVKSETSELDEVSLRHDLGPHLWELVTKRVIDKKKLDAHVVTGDITPATVAKNTLTKPRRPYVRFTVKPQRYNVTGT
jgi:hypothetical protein